MPRRGSKAQAGSSAHVEDKFPAPGRGWQACQDRDHTPNPARSRSAEAAHVSGPWKVAGRGGGGGSRGKD